MPKVKVGDINIYYEVHGEGEPFVLVRGGGASSTSWSGQVAVFSREYQVIVFDPRGTGQSDAPDIPYTTEMIADDIAGLLDAIDIKAAHILGVSFGGLIAQQFALRYPERVTSLILNCTGCGGPHSIAPDAEVMKVLADYVKLTPEEGARQLLPFFYSQEFIDKNPEIIQQQIATIMEYPTPPHTRMRQAEASRGHDTYERLPEIQAPTLVIHGDADRISPVENASILASRIPNAELVMMEKMGHGFMWEAEDEWNRIILDFLKRHRRSS